MLISLQSTMQFITTTKGKPALLFDGSRFTLNRRMDNEVCYWRCAKRICPARITTEGNDLKQQTAPHNHAVDVVDTQVKAIQSDMRKRAREEITPVPAIYNDHLIHLSTHSDRDSIPLQLPTFTSMRSSLYRSCWSRLPPLPLTRCVRQCACTDRD